MEKSIDIPLFSFAVSFEHFEKTGFEGGGVLRDPRKGIADFDALEEGGVDVRDVTWEQSDFRLAFVFLPVLYSVDVTRGSVLVGGLTGDEPKGLYFSRAALPEEVEGHIDHFALELQFFHFGLFPLRFLFDEYDIVEGVFEKFLG